MDNRALFRQFVLNLLVTLGVIFVLLKADLVGYIAYSVERGRLRAARETLPDQTEVALAARSARTVAQTSLPGVVFIETKVSVSLSLEDIFKQLGESAEGAEFEHPDFEHPEEIGEFKTMGSGFIFDADQGLIVTNYHVIEDASEVKIHLADGRKFDGHLVGQDALSDLAVLHIEADNLFELPFGDSELIEIGDDVFSLGSPFGLTGTVSRGIVSGKDRFSDGIGQVVYQRFLQTDAVINPGNSGGPLVDLRGQVVGINTAIATNTGTYNGVGFAIPASRVLRILPYLRSGKPVVRGFLGVEPISIAKVQDAAANLGWTKDYGVLINAVIPNRAADQAGIQVNDILTRINGTRVQGHHHLIETIGQMAPGSTIKLELWRNDRYVTVKAELGSRATPS